MAVGNVIRVRITADSSGVTKGVEEANGRISGAMSKLSGLAVAGYAVAGAAAIKFTSDAINAAQEAEKAEMKLADAYKRFPALHDATYKSLEKLADLTLKKTRFDDEAARVAIANLAQYRLTGDQIKVMLPLVEDFAAKTGKDLPEASTLIGKALLGNTRALKEVGIQYKSTGDAATDYQNIVALLTAKVGGFAAEDVKTSEGRAAQMKNQWSELQQAAGELLLPIGESIIPKISDALSYLATNIPVWAKAITDGWDGVNRSFSETDKSTHTLYELAGGVHTVADAVGWAWGNVIEPAVSWLTGDGVVGLGIWGEAWRRAGILVDAMTGSIQWVHNEIDSFLQFLGTQWDQAWANTADVLQPLIDALHTVIDLLRKAKDLWNDATGWISHIPGFGGLSTGGSSGSSAASAFAAPTSSTGSGWGGSSTVNVNVNVNGNVGDPALIGRRIVAALEASTAIDGTRRLSRLVAS